MWKKALGENDTYLVYNGESLINDLPLKVYDNNFKLFFNSATIVTAIDMLDIPQHTFNFKSFQDFLTGDFVVDRLYVVRTQLPGAGKKACVNLILSNECGVKLGLTMRESFAAQFMSYSHDNGQLVLILTHGVGKVYLNLSNAWNGSKLLLNFEHPQVVEFKAKMLLRVDHSIHAYKGHSMESFCNIIGTTMGFKANPFGWYYEIYPNCNKTNQYICSDNKSTPTSKHKIEIKVEHDNTNEDHPLIYPVHLDNLLEKKYAFRVKWQPYYKQASVVKLTQDEDIIQQIEDAMSPTEATATIATEDVDRKRKAIMADEDLNHNNILTQTSSPTSTASASRKWSPGPSYNNMPSKRFLQDVHTQEPEVLDFLTPRQSATKGARAKSARHTKTK